MDWKPSLNVDGSLESTEGRFRISLRHREPGYMLLDLVHGKFWTFPSIEAAKEGAEKIAAKKSEKSE